MRFGSQFNIFSVSHLNAERVEKERIVLAQTTSSIAPRKSSRWTSTATGFQPNCVHETTTTNRNGEKKATKYSRISYPVILMGIAYSQNVAQIRVWTEWSNVFSSSLNWYLFVCTRHARDFVCVCVILSRSFPLSRTSHSLLDISCIDLNETQQPTQSTIRHSLPNRRYFHVQRMLDASRLLRCCRLP